MKESKKVEISDYFSDDYLDLLDVLARGSIYAPRKMTRIEKIRDFLRPRRNPRYGYPTMPLCLDDLRYYLPKKSKS